MPENKEEAPASASLDPHLIESVKFQPQSEAQQTSPEARGCLGPNQKYCAPGTTWCVGNPGRAEVFQCQSDGSWVNIKRRC